MSKVKEYYTLYSGADGLVTTEEEALASGIIQPNKHRISPSVISHLAFILLRDQQEGVADIEVGESSPYNDRQDKILRYARMEDKPGGSRWQGLHYDENIVATPEEMQWAYNVIAEEELKASRGS